ncbi:hypothetical protein CC85DRAFT_282035 [Cutaneotrichosporon oleaginosum]|uniref:Uncharacterized protein n=1 Tax=Cutaneotrichosporon oleaginosum TaxID=879819 RepID=A0A0J0XXS8_9TREE|nr:uncharacterized protein CC85DRAFT_282035 [Cutaneotrichosporon oleaginosum]KLT45885.1 hypothetical protein CC85DRAFT_282035 [Cutaneotrichosporon oleaginosum]TXT06586.1 hypothetical protein COLE_05917 [Cutaneotrichosporon oleaginosum]
MQEQDQVPRITVERQVEWLRVQENANAALSQSLEDRLSTLPPIEARRLRPKLEAELNAIRDRMWEMAKPNLRVNGFNYEEYVETTEPFDEALDRTLWSLNSERVNWVGKVNNKRRTIPDQTAGVLEDMEVRRDGLTWAPSKEQEAELKQALEDAQKEVRTEDYPPPPRYGEVVDTFHKVIENLSELVETAPKQLERAERVHQVRDEISRLPV